MRIECRTQEEMDAALCRKAEDGSIVVVLVGEDRFILRESSSVEARESSRVVARESSRVVAWGSSRVLAWESSSVEAWGSSSVEARESSSVVASPFVSVHCHEGEPAADQVRGGHVILVPRLATPRLWLDYWGVSPGQDGSAVLFKAVRDDFGSNRNGFKYLPGTAPQAPDWDGGVAECGGGLHFCPHPQIARDFHPQATRCVACPVLIALIAVHPDGDTRKVKAPGLCAPCWEVDEDGEPVVRAEKLDRESTEKGADHAG
jgi:hypothetical protein